MPPTFCPVPLRRFVDAAEWEADDLAGRLGLVAHASFLTAGFVPYGAAPRSGHLLKHVDEIGPSAPRLSRRYTAPQLVHSHGAEVAVLELRAQGDGGVALQAYLLTRDGLRRCLCEALLAEADLAPILSDGLDEAARALETGAPGSWLWKPLADWVCRVLFLQLCSMNDLPVTGFMSLPDDAKAEILKRLGDGKDLAKVECSSGQLRRLVAERDGELWKAMCETLEPQPEEEMGLEPAPLPVASSWKERYVNASRSRQRLLNPTWRWRTCWDILDSYAEEWLASIVSRSRQREADLQASMNRQASLSIDDSSIVARIEAMEFSWAPHWVLDDPPPPPPPVPEPEVVVARCKKARNQRRRKMPRKDCNQKRHGAGAIHAPSSRYRWNHR